MASRNGLLGLIAGTVCAFAVMAGPAWATDVCPGDEDVPTMAGAPQAVAALVCDINVVRANNKLPALRWDWRLWWVAHRRADDMARTQTFSHVRDLADRALAAGYVLGEGGALFENLGWARGRDSTPLALTLGWLRSERHRINILDRRVTDIGIGVAEGSAAPGGPTGLFFVAEFGNTGTAVRAQALDRPARTACPSTRRPRGTRAFRKWRAKRARCRTARVIAPALAR